MSVELYLFPTQYCDVATLGDMATTTGGEVHLYQNFRVSAESITCALITISYEGTLIVGSAFITY